MTVNDRARYTYVRSDSRALHLVQQVPHLLEVFQMGAIRIEGALPLCAFGKRIDEKFRNSARVNLEVQVPCHRVLP